MNHQRINPHESERTGTGPTGRPRIRHRLVEHSKADLEQTELPLRVTQNPVGLILVCLDLRAGFPSDHDLDVIGAARKIADSKSYTVTIAALDPAAEIRWDLAGADQVLSIHRSQASTYDPEADCRAICDLIVKIRPEKVFMPDRVPGMGDIGRRVAVEMDKLLAASVHSVTSESVTASTDGRKSDADVGSAFILLLEPECAFQVSDARYPAALEKTVSDTCPTESPRIKDRGLLPCDLTDIPLSESDFIISAGNGVQDWNSFKTLARKLNGTIGCTRVVCDQGLLPKSRQIGTSGSLVRANCYLAFGISGAPQHLQGVAKCRRVIAINTNPHAEMMRRADLAIVADAQQVMSALLGRISRREQKSA